MTWAPTLIQALVDIDPRLSTFGNEHALLSLLDQRHTAVGARLAREWSLPAHLIETIAFHHHPLSAPAAGRAAATLHLADRLAGGDAPQAKMRTRSTNCCPNGNRFRPLFQKSLSLGPARRFPRQVERALRLTTQRYARLFSAGSGERP